MNLTQPSTADWKCVKCGLPGYDFTPNGFADTAQHRDTHRCMLAAIKLVRDLEARVVELEGGTPGCVCVGTPDEADCPHDA